MQQDSRGARYALCVIACAAAFLTVIRAQTAALDIVVNSTGDQADSTPGDGVCDVDASTAGWQCTLRAAIQTANGSAAGANIAFNISQADPGYANGVFTIRPATNLPPVTKNAVVIDATTQTAVGGDTNPDGPEVILNGGLLTQFTAVGLDLRGSANVVRGFVVNGFRGAPGCGGTSCGVGVWVSGQDSRVEGNFIGTTADGSNAAANKVGVLVFAWKSVIGGDSADARNVIAGNDTIGVWVAQRVFQSAIKGNRIGTNAAGTAAVPNGSDGVSIDGAAETLISGNVIAGNAVDGIALTDGSKFIGNTPPRASATRIEGNLIGVDVTGTQPIGNMFGIRISDADDTRIGGITADTRNVIAASRFSGISINAARRTTVLGNYIGTDRSGTLPLGNGWDPQGGDGITAFDFVQTIGGPGAGEGNVIAFNHGSGVSVTARTGIPIVGNSIHDNDGLGIDLGAAGVTANDPFDSDTGANNLQNFPVLGSVASTGGQTLIAGGLLSAANHTYKIDLYSSPSCDASGHGEGQQYVGRATVTTDQGGAASFNITLPASVPDGTAITSTATDDDAFPNTSEFSACAIVNGAAQADLGVSIAGTPNPVAIGQPLVYSVQIVNSGPRPASNARLTFTRPAAAAFVSAVPSQGHCSGTATVVCQLGVLDVGATATARIEVTAPSTAQTLTASVAAAADQADPSPENNAASVDTAVRPPVTADISVAQSATPNPVLNSFPTALTIDVSNAGPGDAGAVRLTDTIPGGVSLVSVLPSQGTCTPGAVVTCDLGTIASAASARVIINLRAITPGTGTNTAVVSTMESDPNTANNTSTLTLQIDRISSIPVTKTADTDATCLPGNCSLREAIKLANLNPSATIAFNIPQSDPGFAQGVFTIKPATSLPAVTANGITIDGTTQTAFGGDTNAAGPEVVLNGSLLTTFSAVGLDLRGSTDVVRGLVLNGFRGSPGCGGNTCGVAVWVSGLGTPAGLSSRLEGNYIGTTADGSAAVPNKVGVIVQASRSVIGGAAAGAGNVISGNDTIGVWIGQGVFESEIAGNRIGTSRAGTAAVPNGGHGVSIDGAASTLVKGNVIAGNAVDGIAIRDGAKFTGNTPLHATATRIEGNLIGVDVTGTQPIANMFGISVSDGDDTRIGGTTAETRNVIAASRYSGISITAARRTTVLGNFIGTDRSGTLPLGNGWDPEGGDGITVSDFLQTIGGPGSGEGNVIAFNHGNGVSVTARSNNPIVGNAIHDNDALGINLGAAGVTANDAADTDAGANNLLNFPVLTSATSHGGQTTIVGTLATAAGGTYQIDVYSSASCDGSGHGEGERYLGRVTAATDGTGAASFTRALELDLPTGTAITATATDADNNTSEFSGCAALVNTNDETAPVIHAVVTPLPNAAGWNNAAPTVTWTVSDDESDVTASTGCTATTVSQDTDGLTLTCSATNGAGLSASASVTVKLDTIAPTIDPSRTPASGAGGWNRTDVTVSFICADGGSQIASCSDAQTLSEDGADQRVVGVARDVAGNSKTVTVGGINIDKTAPAISAAISPHANANGWHKTDVTVDFTCTDALSGVGVAPSDATLTSEGANQSASAACQDAAGNSATKTVSGINIDKTAPAIAAATSPQPNAKGWHKTDVTVDFSCTDALSGIASAPSDAALTTDGANQSASASCEDIAGNSATRTVSGINIDKTAPVIAAATSPQPNANGWHKTGVTVDFSCTDGLSGIASAPADAALTTEGANQSASASCEDVAGNSATRTVSGINIDTTAPVVTGAATRAPDLNGWYNHAFAVSWSSVDALSGSGACDAAVSYAGPDTAAGELTGSCEDRAGNTARAAYRFQFDATPPAITIAQPAEGAAFLLNETVAASYTCADATSGGATCAGPGPSGSPLATSAAGAQTFTVNAADRAGNVATVTHHYVVNYGFTGFFAPLNNLPTINGGQAGRTFPVRFSLRDANGVLIANPAAISRIAFVPGTCGASTAGVTAVDSTVEASGLKYDPLTGTWQFNWQTTKAQVGCWVLQVRLADGSVHPVAFELR